MRFGRISWIGLLLVAACSSALTPSPDVRFIPPYATITPSATVSPLPVQTVEIVPTPTPVLYTIRPNDTLAGIASRYGVTVEALLAANPGVRPTALKVGSQLVIPLGALPMAPTPTPVPLEVRSPKCWSETNGGLWCFALVLNQHPDALENLSAVFILRDEKGEEKAAQVAYAPLNILPAGQAMPLGVHFPPPVELPADVHVQILTAIRLSPSDSRYLPATLDNLLTSISSDGRSARLSGRVLLPVGERPANSIWVLALAYDAAGNLVGYRRWEAEQTLASGESLEFALTVSSIGPPIERVDFLVEAHP
ncbi:MAG: LysM peptidoglycan-binding domain-containing protein [Anaerolineales bacterium]|nr:LysM peptidoglycan-binding domain-containing protein [Anaerolineales bacterium]MCX7609424.1 LysM peptidoglycan-binding domain-containing protein [Anaerolineales bacterium]MDW8227405.1 LysM peptidoglycan-binding domain-containing protein [Anaerolineales bacterium]